MFKKKIFIIDLKEGERVRWFFSVKAKRLKATRQGNYYLDVVLFDKSGEVSGKVWDDVKVFNEKFSEGDIVFVDAQVEIYNNKKQLRISDIRKIFDGEVNPEEILPSSKESPDRMFDELKSIVDVNVKNSFLKELINRILNKYEKEFKKWPGAVKVHHPYYGGLIEHTLSVTEMCVEFAKKYKLSHDLMVAGGIFHDLGKIKEIGVDKGFYLTEEGILLGHINLGVSMLEEEISKISGFPENLKAGLLHMILSHHGSYENGSSRLPSTKEAFALFVADYLDSQIKIFEDIIEKHDGESLISDFDARLNRRIFVGEKNDKVLEKP